MNLPDHIAFSFHQYNALVTTQVMKRQTAIYNAFTGINPSEKKAVIDFLCEHNPGTSRSCIIESIDYALKIRPSFGGYILTIREAGKIIGTVVVNNTGMEGYNPKNIFVYVNASKSKNRNGALLKDLLKKAMAFTKGDIAMHVEPDHPALAIFEKIGFKKCYLELRFENQQSTLKAV